MMRNLGLLILLIGLLIIFIPWNLLEGQYFWGLYIDLDSYSGFGSFIGGITSIVAVILIYLTYNAQREELNETRNVMRRQSFESTFFNMLEELNRIIELMVGPVKRRKKLQSRQNYMYRVMNLFKEECNQVEIRNKEVLLKKYEDVIYGGHQQNLSHYFRYVYNIIKFIRASANENSNIDDRYYVGLLQARMSNSEMGLLFYNAISIHGKSGSGDPRFFNWLEEYGFFENIDPNFLIKKEHATLYYPLTSFKFSRENST